MSTDWIVAEPVSQNLLLQLDTYRCFEWLHKVPIYTSNKIQQMIQKLLNISAFQRSKGLAPQNS